MSRSIFICSPSQCGSNILSWSNLSIHKIKIKKSLYRTYFKAFIWKLVQAKINLLFLDKVDTDFQQVREIKASTCSTALFSTFKHSSWTSQDVNNQQHFPVFSKKKKKKKNLLSISFDTWLTVTNDNVSITDFWLMNKTNIKDYV